MGDEAGVRMRRQVLGRSVQEISEAGLIGTCKKSGRYKCEGECVKWVRRQG